MSFLIKIYKKIGKVKFVFLALVLCCVCGVAGISLGLYAYRIPPPTVDTVACVEMSGVTDFDEAMRIGDGYFGSGPQYSILCANVAYTKALVIDERRSPLPWYQLGRIYFITGKFEAALYRFEKMIELFGDNALPNVHYMLGLTYGYRAHQSGSQGDWAQAEKEFGAYSELDRESPWSRVDLAWVLFSQAKYAEMKKPLEDALQLHPENPWVLNMYGLALLNTGDAAGALERFANAERALARISPQEWGHTYPGNDPASWQPGLAEMKDLIRANKKLAEKSL